MDIASIKDLVGIEDLLEYYGVDIPERSGWNDWTPVVCPFHDDSNPSASFNSTLDRFNCFGCGVSGDIFDCVMEYEPGVDTVAEAIEWVKRELL